MFWGNNSVYNIITIRKLDLSGFHYLTFLQSPVPSRHSFFMNKIHSLLIILVALVTVLHAEEKKRMPNLIILLADDLGFGELGRQGNLKVVRAGKAWELYDLKADPSERYNFASDQPDKTAELAKLWENWNEESKNKPK